MFEMNENYKYFFLLIQLDVILAINPISILLCMKRYVIFLFRILLHAIWFCSYVLLYGYNMQYGFVVIFCNMVL